MSQNEKTNKISPQPTYQTAPCTKNKRQSFCQPYYTFVMCRSDWAHRSERMDRNWEQEVAGKRGGEGKHTAHEGGGTKEKQKRWKS